MERPGGHEAAKPGVAAESVERRTLVHVAVFSGELLPAASFDFSRVRSLVNGEAKFIPLGNVSAISISDIIERRTRFE